ncbi:MAG TPA: DNA-processing protein DprA [Candidatus Dormibacteraeota bacterium]|nr:DNA-processing protein DprA [Candidatus Dormibacteraeota bacterium]
MTAEASPWRLARGGSGWPARLEHLEAPPAELWIRGALPPPGTPCVAVVGSRRAAPGALLTGRDIAVELAAAGITVISGMARGVDAAAHRGALLGGGVTVAVLGCGIDVCYPAEHLELRDRIAGSGCVLSEDGGREPPLGWRFPRRNRLIAALAEAVVVVEATARSGALSTARWAADLGREVLAVPGSIRSPSSVGTNLLIRDGVRPFLGIADLFEAAPQLRRAMTAEPAASRRPEGVAPLPPEGQSVLSLVLDQLGADPVHPDELAATLGLGMATLATALTTLQLRGAITDVCGGRVARTF